MQAGQGGILGGIEWGFAVDGTTAYVALSNALEGKPGEAGGLLAVNLADGKTRWSAPPAPATTCGAKPGCSTAQPAAVSAMPGVVFSGALDGHLRAYDAASGKVIWDIDTTGAHTTVNGVPANGARPQRARRDHRRRDAVRQLGLRLDWLHARQRAAGLQRGRALRESRPRRADVPVRH